MYILWYQKIKFYEFSILSPNFSKSFGEKIFEDQ